MVWNKFCRRSPWAGQHGSLLLIFCKLFHLHATEEFALGFLAHYLLWGFGLDTDISRDKLLVCKVQNVTTLNTFFLLLISLPWLSLTGKPVLFSTFIHGAVTYIKTPWEESTPMSAPASALHYNSTSTFVFSYSVCQNPEGSWIPKHHLWVSGDVAVHSDRPSSPYCHLAGKWESCKCLFSMLLALEDC